MAVQLQDQGEQVALITMDAYPPDAESSSISNGTTEYPGVFSTPGDAGAVGGFDEAELAADMMDVLRRDADSFGLSDDEISIFTHVMTNNMRVRMLHAPGKLEASLLLVVAGEKHPSGELAADKWKPYASGEISHSSLPCGHQDMVCGPTCSLRSGMPCQRGCKQKDRNQPP